MVNKNVYDKIAFFTENVLIKVCDKQKYDSTDMSLRHTEHK